MWYLNLKWCKNKQTNKTDCSAFRESTEKQRGDAQGYVQTSSSGHGWPLKEMLFLVVLLLGLFPFSKLLT